MCANLSWSNSLHFAQQREWRQEAHRTNSGEKLLHQLMCASFLPPPIKKEWLKTDSIFFRQPW